MNGGTRRAVICAAALPVLAGTLTGCGIRATAVPVDAGAAPTRAACVLPSPRPARTADQERTVRVYLVCGQRLFPVDRVVRWDSADRVRAAGVLLAELEAKPDASEAKNGFASEVPGDLGVRGPLPGDPAGTLRLGLDPGDLPSYAVGQVVCTFADGPATGGAASVVLGGPDRTVPPRRYRCDDSLRTDPDAGPTAGLPAS